MRSSALGRKATVPNRDIDNAIGPEFELQRISRIAMSLSAVVLAAGFSSRIRGFKPLMPLLGIRLLERVVSLYKQSGVEDVRVVVGYRKDELIPIIDKLDGLVVVNPRYSDGMFSSVLCGLKSLDVGNHGCFIHPVDIPMVNEHTIGKLIDSLHANSDSVIYPCFRNRSGHPVLIPSAFYKYIIDFDGGEGLRAALAPLASHSIRVEVDDPNILFDVDNTEDYQALLRNAEPGKKSKTIRNS